jgi:hypothetical protein
VTIDGFRFDQNAKIVEHGDPMRQIPDDLPGIAAAAGVDLIVSQWEVPYRAPDVEVTDVTSDIVALFVVDEETAGFLAQMADVEPMPLEELLYQPEQ